MPSPTAPRWCGSCSGSRRQPPRRRCERPARPAPQPRTARTITCSRTSTRAGPSATSSRSVRRRSPSRGSPRCGLTPPHRSAVAWCGPSGWPGRSRSHSRTYARALVPVDMRPQDDDGRLGNQFGLVFLDMPVGMPGRRQRLDSVHAMMQLARHSPQPSVAFEVLGALGLVPQAIQRQVVRFFGAKGTAVVTNVRGPARRLYLAGERLVNLTFFVPQSAMLGIGISVMTYAGDIQVGVIADAGLVPEPAAIARDITAELRALVRLGGASGGREDDGE